ncbi:uncharacterized protein [Amphiura filiformis]|uniref:uncharacterized protein n=1 Tax=Amphiura filiformis TaxID=82378 RepID=UPI003B20F644
MSDIEGSTSKGGQSRPEKDSSSVSTLFDDFKGYLDQKLESFRGKLTRQNLKEGIQQLQTDLKHRNKLIRLTDKSEGGWKVVDEYESDELASDSEDEKKIRSAQFRAARKKRQATLPILPSDCINDGFYRSDQFENFGVEDWQKNFYEYEQGSSEPIIKGRLRSSIDFWRSIQANDFVLSIIQNGYKLPLITTPPVIVLKNNKSALDNSDFVYEAINDLVKKGLVLQVSEKPTVINPLTVSIQKSGKKRLILDLRHVNAHIWKQKVKFEDWRHALDYFAKGDFLISFDLKSGYHHVDIFTPHQKFLGFSWQFNGMDRFFVFTVLPFGLTSAGHVFTKILRPLVRHWRALGFFLVLYLDDGWCRAPNRESASLISKRVKSDLISAGLVPNCEKSIWIPTQSLVWLGFVWDAAEGSLAVTDRRIGDTLESINCVIDSFPRTTARKLASVTGKIISFMPVVGSIARLMTRFLHHEIVARSSWDSVFRISAGSSAINELFFWKTKLADPFKRHLTNYSIPRVLVFSDASSTGCGAFISDTNKVSHRVWSAEEASESSTWRERFAILSALCSFGSSLDNQSIKVFTDNQSAVSILQAGSMKINLHVISLAIFNHCRQHFISLDVQWIPRRENQIADGISRVIDLDDWGVSPQFFSFVDSIFGPHTVDRFADNFNRKLPVFNSRFWCPGTSGVDAFTSSWNGENNWLVPPVSLVCKAVIHIVASRSVGTLVIPSWPSAAFWPFIFSEHSPVKWVVSEIITINSIRGVFVQGRNCKSLFGSEQLSNTSGSVLIVRLDGRGPGRRFQNR